MKKIALLLCFFSALIFAQKPISTKMGQTTLEELKMNTYEKDSTVNAVVLYEHAHITPFHNKEWSPYKKEYYVRIKILKKSAFHLGTIKLGYYKSGRVKNIEGITYNLSDSDSIEKSVLTEKNIFKIKYNKNFKIRSFSLPNVKVGSVIEYKFTVTTKNYGIYDWEFQASIPKVKTIYTANLSGRPEFKLRMIGYLKPDFEESVLKKRCIGKLYKCLAIRYEMNAVPAFIPEKYMTSEKNFISRISFERTYYNPYVKEGKEREWRTLDKAFKDIYEHQLNLSFFYRKKLPKRIRDEKEHLLRMKKVYTYIQQHFTKTETTKNDLFQAFETKLAKPTQINISLYNALKAANIDNVKLVLLSTRENGYLTKLHASVTDFNYNIVSVKLNEKKYLLDATNKKLPFGLISFECLNGDGRVLDFKNGSYWEQISNGIKSNKRTTTNLTLNSEGKVKGKITTTYRGYLAKWQRESDENKDRDKQIENLESLGNIDLSVSNYTVTNANTIEKPYKKSFDFNIEDDLMEHENRITIAPFMYQQMGINPFKLKERKYPVDFGFKRSATHSIVLNIPANFKLKKSIENKAIKLPNNGGKILLNVSQKENSIHIYFKYQLNKSKYYSANYQELKMFYNQIINIQNATITLEKTSK